MKNIFSYLTKNEGFYMDQCKNLYTKREIWIAVKKFPQGIFAIAITDDKNADIDEREVREHLLKSGMNFSLNLIVLTNSEYIGEFHGSYPRVVININSHRIMYCDQSLEGIGNAAVEIIRRSENPHKKNKSNYVITIALISINIILYVISGILSDNFLDIDGAVLLLLGGKFGPLINNGEWWRIITCNFLHGGLIHIVTNMYSLYIIGSQIEIIFGKLKYIIIYTIAGITSSLFSYYLAPNTLSIGASGAIFGLLGALLSFAIKEKDRINKGVITNILIVVALNIYIGTTIPNIDNYAHFGGLIGGMIISVIFLLTSKKSFY
ncbi:rhomboid family intramembrane serine protease [Clostridium sp. HBUAS56017]|nr:rhomboid family intramembrane serine protease [Clostridium sp. HBUAS56017]